MNKYKDFFDFTKNASVDFSKTLKVCIATPDYLFFKKNMGIGTSFYHTAQVLSGNGFDVTILYCNLLDHLTAAELETSKSRVTESGVKLHLLFEQTFKDHDLDQFYPNDLETVSSCMAYRYLRNTNFDIIIFPEWRGIGFYSQLAKRMGLAFNDTALWVQTHSTCLWHGLNNEQCNYNEHDLRVFHLERKSVELADLVISPTNYLLDWKEKHGFILPKDAFVQPYLLSWNFEAPPIRKRTADIQEFVFFGRLEKRKGLRLFCQALRILHQKLFVREKPPITITFLGKITEIEGISSYDYISKSLEGTNFTLHFLTSFNSIEAVSYLKKDGRVAIIPSVADNSPLTVLECIYNSIPFVAANTGGIPEIINTADHAHALFNADARSLAEKLTQIIHEGASVSFPVIDQQDVNIPVWMKALRLSASVHKSKTALDLPGGADFVSVCIPRFENYANLCVALEGLAGQTTRNFEVIVIDDGSCPDIEDKLPGHADDCNFPFSLRIVRQKNALADSAVLAAFKEVKGRHVIFMDGDSYPGNALVETFLSCAMSSGYDALSCFAAASPQIDPDQLSNSTSQHIPLGGGLAPNMFGNYYAGGAAIYKREMLLDIIAADGEGVETWRDNELFSKIELSGAKTSVVPEILLYTRMTNRLLASMEDTAANRYNSLRPMLGFFPWKTFGDALLLSFGQKLRHGGSCAPSRFNTSASRSLIGSSEHSVLSLRWLTRRMSEVGDHHGVATALLDHYRTSSVFDFCLLEFVSYFLNNADNMYDAQEYCDGDGESDFIKIYEKLISERNFEGLAYFVEEQLKDSIDRSLLLAKIFIMNGDIFEGLKAASAAFIEIDNRYKLKNYDLIDSFSLPEDVYLNDRLYRSGLSHWLLLGRNEGRALDYCPPIAAPISPCDAEFLVDYQRRLESLMRLSLAERGNAYAELLFEALENNAPVVFSDLATVILRDANVAYLEAYPEVSEGSAVEFSNRGIEHYLRCGRKEGKQSLLAFLEANYKDILEKYSTQVAPQVAKA